MGQKVERVQTAIGETEMAQAVIQGWQDLFGAQPSKEQVAIIMAQNSLETGHRKSMWNYNVGNIKADPNGKYDYFMLVGPEQLSKNNWKNLKMSFRAYSNLKEGVLDYLKLLSTSQRYKGAWEHILHPNIEAYSKALKAGGYYTADEAPYTKGLKSLFDQFNKSNNYETAMAQKTDIPPSNHTAPVDSIYQKLEMTFDNIMKNIAASDKRLYNKFLPKHDVLIKVQSNDYVNAVEFSRVLCNVLEEELQAKAYIYSSGKDIEVQCLIAGPAQECFNTVKELSESTSEVFKDATIKINNVYIKTNCVMNKKSSYQEINPNSVDACYRMFLLKFV